MLKPFIPAAKLILSSLVLTAALFSNAALSQGKDDFNQPIRINAERDWVDIANKIVVFERSVIIEQGSLKITADKLSVEREGEAEDAVFIAEGAPAVYTQQLEDGSVITAKANQIIYDQAQQLLTLRGNVEVAQGNSVSRGGEMVYNFATQQMTTRGDKDTDRVTTIYMPKQQDDKNNEQP